MKIKLNTVEFDVAPVPSALREVLLADEIIRQGVTRDVWAWDHATQTGKLLVSTTESRAVPLPNGISFFVPRAGQGDIAQKAEAPTAKMATRFVEAVGGKSIVDLMQALNNIVKLAQKSVPTTPFARLNPVASYVLRQHIEYAVVHLVNAGRNLSAYFFIPGQVSFTYALGDVADPTALQALFEADPKLRNLEPGFVVPPGTQANMMMRRMAMLQRLNDMQMALGGQNVDTLPEGDPRRLAVARMGVEWRVLAPPRNTVA